MSFGDTYQNPQTPAERLRSARSIALALVTLSAAAMSCGRIGFSPRADDAGTSVDAARPADAGALDTGARDAGGLDAGPDDAGDALDGGGDCTEAPCRLLLPQCGCAADRMCGWDTSAPRACVLVGSPAAGATCNGRYDCAPGAGCIVLGSGRGQCLPWCGSTADCTLGTSCVALWWSGPPGVCSLVCDPINNTGCPAPLACSVGLGTEVPSGTTVVEALCANLGAGAVDAPCTGPLDCQRTLACFGTVCRPVCRMDVAASCSGTCLPFAPRAFIGGIEYGGCV